MCCGTGGKGFWWLLGFGSWLKAVEFEDVGELCRAQG